MHRSKKLPAIPNASDWEGANTTFERAGGQLGQNRAPGRMIIFHRLAVTYNEETQESIGSIPSKLFPWEFLQAKRAGMEVEFAAEEEDTDSVVVEIVEATSRGFQILNPTIESLSTAFWIRSVLWKMASRPPSLRAPTPRNRSDEHLAEASRSSIRSTLTKKCALPHSTSI